MQKHFGSIGSKLQRFNSVVGVNNSDGSDDLQEQIQVTIPSFRHNRLFAIGVFTMLELADSDLVKDNSGWRHKQMSAALHIPE